MSKVGRPKAVFPCTGHVAYRISCNTDGNACYERQGRVWYINRRLHILVRVPQSLHEMNLGFGEWEVGLRCNRTPSYCARSYTEVLPVGCWNDASRGRASIPFKKMKGQRWLIPHLIWGGKRIDISMWYSPFHFRWERTAKSIRTRKWRNKRRAKRQWRAKRMRKGHGEIKKCGGRSSRAHSLRFLGPKQCFVSWPNQGFGADCKRYLNRKIDPSIYPDI